MKLGRAYATEPAILLCNFEVSATPLREPLRLAIGTAIPREANDSASGTAAVRKGSEARMKAKEYISSRTLKHLTGAHCSNTDHRMDLRKYRAIPPGFLYFWRIRFSASRKI